MSKVLRLRDDRSQLRLSQKELLSHLDDIFSILNQVQDRLNLKIDAVMQPLPIIQLDDVSQDEGNYDTQQNIMHRV